MAKCRECGRKAGFLMSQCDSCLQAAVERQAAIDARPEEEPEVEEEELPPPPPTDRELLERIAKLVAQQQADLQTIRWRTGCLYAWLVLGLIIGIIALLGRG